MKRAVVVGGSRGLGRGAVESLKDYQVAVVGRDGKTLPKNGIVGDASDEALAERVLHEKPELVVICAGASPPLGPFHEQTWEQFQTNWQADTKIAFVWLRQALRQALTGHIIVVSSGAAVQGSPVSGGYASAKRAQWFLAQYAKAEIDRAKLDLRIHCLLPNINPSTELGRAGIAAYAKRNQVSEAEFARRFLPHLTPEIFGAAVAGLAAEPNKWPELAYRVSGGGLVPV